MDGALELLGQLLVDDAEIVPLVGSEDVVAATAVGLVAFALVAGLEDEVVAFDFVNGRCLGAVAQ